MGVSRTEPKERHPNVPALGTISRACGTAARWGRKEAINSYRYITHDEENKEFYPSPRPRRTVPVPVAGPSTDYTDGSVRSDGQYHSPQDREPVGERQPVDRGLNGAVHESLLAVPRPMPRRPSTASQSEGQTSQSVPGSRLSLFPPPPQLQQQPQQEEPRQQQPQQQQEEPQQQPQQQQQQPPPQEPISSQLPPPQTIKQNPAIEDGTAIDNPPKTSHTTPLESGSGSPTNAPQQFKTISKCCVEKEMYRQLLRLMLSQDTTEKCIHRSRETQEICIASPTACLGGLPHRQCQVHTQRNLVA